MLEVDPEIWETRIGHSDKGQFIQLIHRLTRAQRYRIGCLSGLDIQVLLLQWKHEIESELKLTNDAPTEPD
jgi:hypothetical protein